MTAHTHAFVRLESWDIDLCSVPGCSVVREATERILRSSDTVCEHGSADPDNPHDPCVYQP